MTVDCRCIVRAGWGLQNERGYGGGGELRLAASVEAVERHQFGSGRWIGGKVASGGV